MYALAKSYTILLSTLFDLYGPTVRARARARPKG